MEQEFSATEVRIIGVLIEKQLTTPEYYPLTLNSLLIGCNQKSNRHPVMALSEEQVTRALGQLQIKRLVRKISFSNSRVARYQHLFDDYFQPDIREKVILCELFLRGPQTGGELRTHTARMHPAGSVEEVQQVLDSLVTRPGGPYVTKLERRPGQKENRYAHLFCGEVQDLPGEAPRAVIIEEVPLPPPEDKVASLEKQVAHLNAEVAALKERVEGMAVILEELK